MTERKEVLEKSYNDMMLQHIIKRNAKVKVCQKSRCREEPLALQPTQDAVSSITYICDHQFLIHHLTLYIT